MKKLDNSGIDGLFQQYFDQDQVSVQDRDALWQRIQNKPQKRKGLFFLFTGVIIAVGMSFSIYNGGVVSDLWRGNVSEMSGEAEALLYDHNENKNDFDHLDLVDRYSPTTTHSMGSGQASSSNTKSTTNLSSNTNSTKTHSRGSGHASSSTTIPFKIVRDKELSIISEYAKNRMKKEIDYTTTYLSNPLKPFSTEIKKIESSKNDRRLKNKKGPLNSCIVENNKTFFVDLYSSAFIPFDQVGLTNGFEDQIAYRDTWTDRNRTLPSLSAGVSVGVQLNNGLDISIGLEYQKFESQYDNVQTVTEIITVFDPMAYFFFDDNGETVWVADSVTAISQYDRVTSFGSATTLINIPLQISYPLLRRGPWNIKLSAAAIFNFSKKHRGQFLSNSLILTPIDETNESTYFNSNIGLSYELGGHLGYQLTDHIELYMSPRFRFNQQSYLKDSEPLKLSRHFAGMRFGALHSF